MRFRRRRQHLDSGHHDRIAQNHERDELVGRRSVCTTIPEETAGPFPGDGSNGPTCCPRPASSARTSARASGRSAHRRGRSAHDQPRAQGRRRTARRSPAPRSTCGTATATAATRCTPKAPPTRTTSAACRADDDGVVTFTSIFPARYSGRWPHIHFEVYPSLETATDGGTQDRDVADRAAEGRLRPVYATDGLRAERPEPGQLACGPTWSSATTAAFTSSGR